MVISAHRDKIGDLRLAAVGPVLDMMRIQESALLTAGEATTRVTPPQGPPQSDRYDARLASDVEGRARRVLDPRHQGCVATQAPQGLGRDGGAVFDLAATVGVWRTQHGDIDVYV
jgi:hypothetical protein